MCVMKLNKYFMMGAMGLSLVACSDNLDEKGQSANGTNPNEGTTYVAFAVDFNGTQSRATEEGTDDEVDSDGNGISSAYVIMADAEGNFSKVLSMNEDAVTSGEGYNTTAKKYLFQTEPGTYTFYAVINPDEVPAAGGTVSDYFDTPVQFVGGSASAYTLNIATADNFMLANQTAEPVAVKDNITEQQALEGGTAETNSFTINVERVSAKVTVTAADDAVPGDAGGTISGTTFNLRGGAMKSFRMTQGSTAEAEGNSWDYEVLNTNVLVSSDANAYRNASPVYCLENLHTTYVQDETTYITIKTAFIPSKVVNASGEVVDNTETTAKTFYVVSTGDLAGNYILADADGSEPELPNGVTAVSGPYTDGVCWFGPIWFGQEIPNESATAPVNRNTWYNLNITNIELPGSPNEPEPIEDEELEPATNVAITLSILPWNFKNIEVDLQ